MFSDYAGIRGKPMVSGNADRYAHSAGSSIPLPMFEQGKPCHVEMVRGKDDTKRFLGSLGFADGAEVMLISEMGGNVIVNVKGTRVAVGKAMAMKILVN